MRSWLLIGLVPLSTACQERNAQSGDIAVRDSAGIEIVENAGNPWLADVRWDASEQPVLRIGAVEGEEAYLFDGVRGVVVLSDGRLVIANSGDHSLRWFDEDGRFLFQRGGEGEGPGEFSRLGAITSLRGDSVVAVDWAGLRFTIFGPDGTVGPTRRIVGLTAPPGRMYRLSSGEWILGTSGASTAQLGASTEPGRFRLDSPILRISSDGARIDTLGQFPSTEAEIVEHPSGGMLFGPAHFGRTLSYAVSDDQVLVGTADRLQYEIYSPDGRHVRSVRALDTGVELTPEVDAEYRRFLRDRAAGAEADERAAAERRVAAIELPATMPAYSSILVDDNGNAWVGEYRFDASSPEQFLVFNREGRFIGRARVPESLRIMAIREGHVWGRTRDELGVEYVVAHRLE